MRISASFSRGLTHYPKVISVHTGIVIIAAKQIFPRLSKEGTGGRKEEGGKGDDEKEGKGGEKQRRKRGVRGRKEGEKE